MKKMPLYSYIFALAFTLGFFTRDLDFSQDSTRAGRTIASLMNINSCQTIINLQNESNKLEDNIQSVKNLLATVNARQAGVPTGQITESSYAAWARQNQGMTKEHIANYHQLVLKNQQQFNQMQESSWSAQYNRRGDLINPLYGSGPETFQHISNMYSDPTSPALYSFSSAHSLLPERKSTFKF